MILVITTDWQHPIKRSSVLGGFPTSPNIVILSDVWYGMPPPGTRMVMCWGPWIFAGEKWRVFGSSIGVHPVFPPKRSGGVRVLGLRPAEGWVRPRGQPAAGERVAVGFVHSAVLSFPPVVCMCASSLVFPRARARRVYISRGVQRAARVKGRGRIHLHEVWNCE